ncbi:phosphotransferase family protein [Streptomyces sp. NPDC058646]|uniref:phosphotransferase family protein n=1 Tax=Streptomyces sp. NPDC058646 TaxID=3346574 RepID=UPI003663BA2B
MLPRVETDEEWDTVVPDETLMRPGVEDLCARLGLGAAPISRFPEGSQPVYAIGEEHVLKLFPAAAAEDGIAEGRVLSFLHGRLPVPTPEVRDFGPYVNGWQYVLMSRLTGAHLAPAWADIPQDGRERLVTETGETLAVLHSLDPAPLADVLGPAQWDEFVERRRRSTVEQQRRHGLADAWLDRIPEFLASVPLPCAPPRSLLHTEVMQQHLLHDAEGPRLTGLFDFEPAMIGDPAYDFVGVGLFVTRGDPRLLRRLCTAYGRTFDPAQLLAYTLLHVYSNLPWYMKELPVPPDAPLAEVAEAWFGTA